MKESSTYQAILTEGRAEGLAQGIAQGIAQGAVDEAKRVLRLQGDDAFGPPDARTAGVIAGLNDLARLEDLLRRVRTVASWQELLGPSGGPRRGRRRQAP